MVSIRSYPRLHLPGRSVLTRVGLGLVSAAALLTLASGPTLAAAAVDQSQLAANNLEGGALDAQTFTVGVTGQLTAVDLKIETASLATDTVTVVIEHVPGTSDPNCGPLGCPDGTSLAHGSASITKTLALVHFTLATPLAVTAGQHYAIVFVAASGSEQVSIENGPPPAGLAGGVDSYPSGNALYFQTVTSPHFWTHPNGDSASDWVFQTWVDPPAPAPVTSAPDAAPMTPPPTSTGSQHDRDVSTGSLLVPAALAGLLGSVAFLAYRRRRRIV